MGQQPTSENPSTRRAWIVGLLFLAVLAIALIANQIWRNYYRPPATLPPIMGPAGIPVPPNLPGIQDTEEVTIAPEEAKILNEEQPFIEEPPIPAKPFRLTSGSAEMNRAVDCLASAIFYEAGNETIEGKMAVAQVILNRMRHPAYPKSVCGVVFQGAERTDRLCQFTFACDGALRRTPSARSWGSAQGIARQMLTGYVYKPVGWATHYHTDWVFPSWSKKLDKVRREGTHLFFRWREFWGTPAAFRGRYAGSEINVGKLAALSPFHLPDQSTFPDDLLGTETVQGVDSNGLIVNQPLIVPKDLKTLPPPPAFAKLAYSNASGDYQLYHIGRGIEPESLLSLSLRACGDREFCKVLMWTDNTAVPNSLPVSDAALKKLAFSYLRNRSTGFEKPLWDCALFQRAAVGQCIKHQGGRPPQILTPLGRPAPVQIAPATQVQPAALGAGGDGG